jgi:hypothetical protein
MWSAEDNGIIVDLTKDDDALPPVKQEEYDAAGSGSGGG